MISGAKYSLAMSSANHNRCNPSACGSNVIFSVSDVAARLNADAGNIIRHFHGEPNLSMSNNRELRWYGDGKLRLKLDGTGKWMNFASGQYGDALDIIKIEIGGNTSAAVEWGKRWLGTSARRNRQNTPRAKGETEHDALTRRIQYAISIWQKCLPLNGTIAEQYLVSRHVRLSNELRTADALRFHPKLKHPSDGHMPAMVALFREISSGKPCGIHRTFLREGKRHSKLMLGKSGGAAIMLSPDENVDQGLGIAEGIETALAWYSRGWRPVWAVGSAGNIANFPVLYGLECLTVFADNDKSSRGEQAARTCCKRYSEAGIEAICRMPVQIGTDWNDWMAA